MKKFKISKIDIIVHDKAIEPHIMINPNTGEQVTVTMQSDHEDYIKNGFIMPPQGQSMSNSNSNPNVPNTTDNKFEKGGEKIDKYENLTGEYIGELPTRLLHKADSEVEDDEYLKFPNGDIKEAEGETHENGGIDLKLPNGTQILSNNLTVDKELAKQISKEHDLKVKSTDTYADVLGKYEKKIGLEELNDTQAEFFKMLDEEDKTPDSKTKKVNLEYINSKILDIETKKKALGEDKAMMFNKLFDKQEESKPKSKKEEKFMYGGLSRSKVEELADKHGLTVEKAMFLLGGEKGYYANGDTVGGGGDGVLPTYDITQHTATPIGNVAGHQSKVDSYYGLSNDEILTRMQETKQLFPELTQIFGENNYSSENVGGFQTGYNKQAEANLAYAKSTMSPEEYKKYAEKVKSNMFTSDPKSVRYTDKKLGDFTSSRPGFAHQLFNEEVTNSLKAQGITHLSQVLDNPEKAKAAGLTEEEIARAKAIRETNPNINFSLLPTKQGEVISTPIEDQPKPEDNIVSTGFIPQKQGAKGFVFPDQSLLPPGALEPHLLAKSRRQRIDPVKVGVEDQLTEINRQAKSVENQLKTLPANQRAAALASILSTTQSTASGAIGQVNRLNAQQQQSAELFNVQQADTERQLQNANLLNFEQRQLTAKAKTDKDLRDYLEFNRNVALNNYRNQQTLNMIDTLSPDYSLDLFGNAVQFDPSYNYQLNNNNQ